MDPADRKPRRVAVIGGGIAGIACTYALRAHSDINVHVFEAEERLGGHADTNIFQGNGLCAGIDTGFIAFNEQTYRMYPANREVRSQELS
jgi:predicted NAD/FAD-binding protein